MQVFPPLNAKFVIPSLAGFYALYVLREEDRVAGFHRMPVIGWAIDENNCVVAITSEGIDEQYEGILNPDGTVDSVIASWPSAEAWEADAKAGDVGRGEARA